VRRTPEALNDALNALDARQLRRRRSCVPDGLVDFCSNDYLGLRTHPQLRSAVIDAARSGAIGAGASHLVSGHDREHDLLERALAEFTGRERALVFSTGYMANLGVLAALVDRDDLILQDRLNHASLIDAALLSRAREFKRYPHNDADAAHRTLIQYRHEHPKAGALIATDGVFSMDGDIAPLRALADIAQTESAWLVVDDAHGLGVVGAEGRGVCELNDLDQKAVPVLIGTFGKALGTFGAFVAGEAALIDWLIQSARTYIYTTALPPPIAAATRRALQLIDEERWRREKLYELIEKFRQGAQRRGLSLMESQTAIQPIICGSAAAALHASAYLRDHGFHVAAIRPPTVPEGSARLRITLSAHHETNDIERLLIALEGAMSQSAPREGTT